jgi:hypothetical protein
MASLFSLTNRSVIILSMVCSKGSSPTQSQLMHFQRANVAMSRARDQLVLFRSLDIQDVTSPEDMKIPILEFFLKWSKNQEDIEHSVVHKQFDTNSYHHYLASVLMDMGYKVHSMGRVWKNGICVEHPDADTRVGLLVECVEESMQEWFLGFKQQKAIERVGWKCLRVDVVSLATRLDETMTSIIRFLRCHGIFQPVIVYDTLEEDSMKIKKEDVDDDVLNIDQMDDRENEIRAVRDLPAEAYVKPYVVVSSDDEDVKKVKVRRLSSARSDPFDVDDNLDASAFGETVELDFLLSRKPQKSDMTFDDADKDKNGFERKRLKSRNEDRQESDAEACESQEIKTYASSSTESSRTGVTDKVSREGYGANNDMRIDNHDTKHVSRNAMRKARDMLEANDTDNSETDQNCNVEKMIARHSLRTKSGRRSASEMGSNRRVRSYRQLEKYQQDRVFKNDSEHSDDVDTKLEEDIEAEDADDWGMDDDSS